MDRNVNPIQDNETASPANFEPDTNEKADATPRQTSRQAAPKLTPGPNREGGAGEDGASSPSSSPAQGGITANARVYGTQQAGRPLEAAQLIPNALQFVGGQAASRIPRADEQADGRTVVNGPTNLGAPAKTPAKKGSKTPSPLQKKNAAGRSTGGVLAKIKGNVQKVGNQVLGNNKQQSKQADRQF